MLESAFRNTLIKTEELGASTVALPAISTGVYGYPANQCARIQVISKFAENANVVKVITVCLYDDPIYEVFRSVFRAILKSAAG